MKEKFLKELNESDEHLDKFISQFMDFKNEMGNGVGAGKLFERIFVDFINMTLKDVYSVHLNLSNSNFIWDIIVSDNANIKLHKSSIIDIIKTSNNIDGEISNLLGDEWICISLKTYKEDSCQITTDYSYRSYLEDLLGEGETDDYEKLNEFHSFLNKHDENRYITLALNTYDSHLNKEKELKKLTNKFERVKDEKNKKSILSKIEEIENSNVVNSYTFRLLNFNKKFDKITFKKNKKLSQYDLSFENNNYFKVLYGKNQANPFQRGIWTHNNKSIEYFELIKKGSFEPNTNFFENEIITQFDFYKKTKKEQI